MAGQPEGGYTDAFEIVCCDCGDDPDLDYRDVSPELQRIRGPYQPIANGVAAYETHAELHSARPGRQLPGHHDPAPRVLTMRGSPARG